MYVLGRIYKNNLVHRSNVARRPHGEFEGYLIRMVERKPYGEDCKQVMGYGEVVYI